MSNYIKVNPSVSEGWQRPSELISIPNYTENEEVVYMVVAVWDTTSNPIALLCNGTGAGYTVDWGDGNIIDYSFNVKAEHNYNYNDLSADTLVSYGHFRQTLVKITPKSGATISLFNIHKRHTNYNYLYNTGIIDVVDNLANAAKYYCNGSDGLWHDNILRIKCKNFASGSYGYRNFQSKSLEKLQIFSIDSSIYLNTIFGDCPSLNIEDGDLPSVITNTGVNLFDGCQQIEDLSWLSTPNINSRFASCYKLRKLPNQAMPTNMGSAFNAAYSINVIPAINLSSCTTFLNWLLNIDRRIRRSLAYGAINTHSYANQLLDATALNEIFTNLGTANTGASITITGNPGAGACDTSIATAKGWTVIN